MRAIHKRFDGLFLWAVTAIVFPAAFVWGGARLLAQLPSPSAAVSAAEECPAAFPLEGIALRGEEPLFLPADALLIPSDGERLPAGALLARLPDGEERRCTRPCVFFTGSDGLETLSLPELSALNTESVAALLEAEAESAPGCRGRLVYDGAWFFAALAPEDLPLPEPGPCRLRFSGQCDWLPARLLAVGEAEGGRRPLLFRLTCGGELLSLRRCKAELFQ